MCQAQVCKNTDCGKLVLWRSCLIWFSASAAAAAASVPCRTDVAKCDDRLAVRSDLHVFHLQHFSAMPLESDTHGMRV